MVRWGQHRRSSPAPRPTFAARSRPCFRDEHGFAILSLEQPDDSRVRALGYLPPTITLRAAMRIAGTSTQHAQYGWQVQVRTAELMDRG